jgi:LPXTG-motif cell wall-anchored protein
MAPSPAPTVAAPAEQPVAEAPKAGDDTARWLAGAALIVAAAAVAFAVIGRRRT